MSEYTKGPWKVDRGGTGYPRGISGERNVINWRGISRAATHEGQCNARLIAAAPDLLQALKGWQEELRTSYRDMTHSERAIFDAAELAIAKVGTATQSAIGEEA